MKRVRLLTITLAITVMVTVTLPATTGAAHASSPGARPYSSTRAELPTSCTIREIQLPWFGYEYLMLVRSDGAVVHLQRDISSGQPVVDVYVNYQWSGQYPLPLQIDPNAVVTLEQTLGLETWLGSVQQTWKFIPVARFCVEAWTPYWYTQDGVQPATGSMTKIAAPTTSKALQPLSCSYKEVEVPWFGYHYLILQRQDGSSVILQRYVYNGKPTAVVFLNYANEAQYYLPLQVASDLMVYMKSRTVYKTVNGKITSYTSSVPVARYCISTLSVSFLYPQQPV